MANFGEVLSGLMIEKNITSQELAKDLGITAVCVNRWKTNTKDIGLFNLLALCKYFNCSLDYLVGNSIHDTKPSKTTIENFGKRVREVMQSKGISSYTLRKDTRFHGKYFYVWDKGANPKLSTLIELANYFKCSLDELVGLE